MTRAEGPLQTGSMDPDVSGRPHPPRIARTGGAWIGWQLAQFENSPGMLNGPIQQARRNSTRPLDPEPLAVIRGPAPRPEADRGLCQRVSALGMHQLQALGHKVTLQPAA